MARDRAGSELAGRPDPDAGRHDRGRPRAARLHRQRDGGAARRRASRCIDPHGGRERPRQPADPRRRRQRISATIRCGRCGWRASPASSTSRSTPGRGARRRQARGDHARRARAGLLRVAAAARLRRRDARDRADGRGRSRRGAAARARGAEGRRAEPVPPPRRLGSHARRARIAARVRARPDRRVRRLAPSADGASWPGRWPTTSRAVRRCGSPRCCTTSASRRRGAVTDEGRVLFIGHDQLGARDEPRRSAGAFARAPRCRTSSRRSRAITCASASSCTSGRSRAAHVYRYLRACEPVELEVTVLTVADRLATRGERTRQEAVEAHLELARELAGEALAWRGRAAASRRCAATS